MICETLINRNFVIIKFSYNLIIRLLPGLLSMFVFEIRSRKLRDIIFHFLWISEKTIMYEVAFIGGKLKIRRYDV